MNPFALLDVFRLPGARTGAPCEFSDICEMTPCIKNLSGFASNSASPTDTWKVEFHDPTELRLTSGKNPVSVVFVKLFIQPTGGLDEAPRYGLNYEIKVYSRVTNPLISFGACPHFVRT